MPQADPDRFADRREAGQALAARLGHLRGQDGIVLALPRGGVPVAAEVAQVLGLPLDLLLVRKVGVPGREELAVAAIAGAEGATLAVNDDVARMMGLTRDKIEALAERQKAELARRRALWLAGRPEPRVEGRLVVLVDDGMATGATMRAAVAALRGAKPSRIVVAVPVAPPEALADLRRAADEVVCALAPDPFWAVGSHYVHFPQIADEAVRALLDAQPPAPPQTPDQTP